jgi:DNA-binding SARP family transcriptional activator
VSLAVRLVGKPAIERDGVPVRAPRGRKAWGLLLYLVLSERPPPRARLASLLFAEADDPLGALRWSLGELRRALNDPLVLRGDPPALRLPEGTSVDVFALLDGEGGEASASAWEGELLEGMSFPGCPAFETWLTHQRRHLSGVCQALMHEAALERLATGDVDGASELAARLVSLDPLELRWQELLIRCLARSGDRSGAERQLAACERLFVRELGVEPGPELRLAARRCEDPVAAAVGDRDAAFGQLQAGRAALDAGAVAPGIDCLRLACAEAGACGDAGLQAESLIALGSSLVHAVRGRDGEGAAVLHEALAIASGAGDRASTSLACRELGYIDVQAGRNASGSRWLARASGLASSDAERCAILGVRGMALSDRAYYPAALELLERSVELAEGCGQTRQAAWSLSLIGRVHLLRDDFAPATTALDRSLRLAGRERWTAFRPWPDSLQAEVSLRTGEPGRALERAEGAFRLACSLGDPCWEATAARVIGLAHAADGDGRGAREWLAQARSRATRVADPYEWVHGHVLDAGASLAIDGDGTDPEEIVRALNALADRTGMRELAVRGRVHQARLGVPAALDAARLLGSEIDNPALAELLSAAVPV